MIPNVRHAFQRERLTTLCDAPSLTKQEFKETVDIHNIIKKYVATGQITHLNRTPAQYGYATGKDFHEAMNTVISAQEDFQSLPAELRARFGNDPGQMLDFIDDPANADELVKLGLIAPPAKLPQEAPKEAPAADASTGDESRSQGV